MPATFPVHAYTQALVVLATAGIVVPIVQRFAVSPVLVFLAAGAVFGPFGLGALGDAVPLMRYVTVTESDSVAAIADLGIVFLLFLVGLELSYERLLTMRRLVFGLGGLQVVLSALAIGAIAAQFGQPPVAAAIIGASLALSSTAIVIELLARQRRLTSVAGRMSFAVLVFQDLGIVPILLLISIYGADSQGGPLLLGLVRAVVQAGTAIAVIVVAGRLLLRPLFHLVARAEASEVFVAASLFVIVATAVAAGAAGLSMALGAFVAGLLLAETEFRKAIETVIDPFKGLLLGVFFFAVGMHLDIRELAREPVALLFCALGLIALKGSILALLARAFRLAWPATTEVALLLAPGGEFAFVAIGMAAAAGLVAPAAASFLFAVTSVTMALLPALAAAARRLAHRLEAAKPRELELLAEPPASGPAGRALVVGHGRVGQLVCEMLEEHKFPFIASDRDPDAVAAWRRRGREVYYGDATNPQFLMRCGLREAAAVIVTIHTREAIDEIVRSVRALRPDVAIVSRARDAEHARHLYAIGVTDAVPETLEASLQLSEAALVGLGLATGPVIASIHARRDRFRHELQEAARHAGRTEMRGLRAKTRHRS
jgi:CPA2 family monovalent cation:H+ antiporter-2